MDYREDNKAERESRAAIFERKLTELGAGMRKELGARPNHERHWWGADLTIESESTLTIALPLRMAGPSAALDIRLTLPSKYPAVAVHLKLSSSNVSPACLEHLREWVAGQLPRLQGKPHMVEVLDLLFAGAERRLSEFDVNDWSEAQQQQLEEAVQKCTSDMAPEQRFEAIGALVDGKTKHQCLARCRFLKANLSRQATRSEEAGASSAAAMDENAEDDWGEGGGRRGGRASRRAAREEAAMLGLGSYASDGEEGDEESDGSGEEDEDEDDDDDDAFDEEYEDGGVTNIYPSNPGDADVDGVRQHSGTQVSAARLPGDVLCSLHSPFLSHLTPSHSLAPLPVPTPRKAPCLTDH